MDLLTSVTLESLDNIKELIAKQGIPGDTEWTDYKSLNTALAYGMKDAAMFLLNHNCRVNKTLMSSVQETTPLHNAVKSGDVRLVKELLNRKASVMAMDSEGNSPLHLAFIAKQEPIVDLLLDKIQQSSNYIHLENKHGVSHLHIACTRNNVQVIQGFLDNGANIEDLVNEDAPMWAGFAAIHFAVNFKSLEALKFLLKLNAKQNKATTGKTPLDLAYDSIADWLIMIDILRSSNGDSSKKLSYFHLACMNEDHKVVENFIDRGVNVNALTPLDLPTHPSSSSLHCAVASRDKEKVKLLLEKGAAVDSLNSAKMTPLHLALYNETSLSRDTTVIVDMIYAVTVTQCPNVVNRVDENGLSSIHVAITRNDVPRVKRSLDAGILNVRQPLSPSAKHFAGYSALHFAVYYQYPRMVELLLDFGNADVNAMSAQGTPLHIAFYTGELETIDLLLRRGARVDLLDPLVKCTMLHLLAHHCFHELNPTRRIVGGPASDAQARKEREILLYVDHLVKLGVDVNARDTNGNTALHYVNPAREGCARYFQLLLDLGADVNVENHLGRLPFNLDEAQTEARYNSLEHVLFHDHVQKLNTLGMKVHPKNEEAYQRIAKGANFEKDEVAAKQRQRLEEVLQLRKVKLDCVTTLLDFLTLDPTRACLFAKCPALKQVAKDPELMEKYPTYGYLLRLQWQRVVAITEKSAGADAAVHRKRQCCE